jgi:hypothetical protein
MVFMFYVFLDRARTIVCDFLDLDLFVVSPQVPVGLCLARPRISAPQFRSVLPIEFPICNARYRLLADVPPAHRLAADLWFNSTRIVFPLVASPLLTELWLSFLEGFVKLNGHWAVQVYRCSINMSLERKRKILAAMLPHGQSRLKCQSKDMNGSKTLYPVNKPLEKIKALERRVIEGSQNAADNWTKKRFVLGKVLVAGPTGRPRYQEVDSTYVDDGEETFLINPKWVLPGAESCPRGPR